MNQITQKLSLDLTEISHNVINARQNDKLTRNLDITITEKGYSYPIVSGTYIYIRGKRADGKSVFYSAEIIDYETGKIHVDIHDYLLSVPGRCTLDIGIYNRVQTKPGNDADEIASTEPFILYVPEGVFDEDDIVNSDEGSTLAKLINSARDEIAEMNALEADVTNQENIRKNNETERQINESNRKADETARNNNELNRNNAENERKNNETARNNAENVRNENETKRQSDTSEAIDRANDAAEQAEQKASDLQNKLDSHEIVLADDLQAHNSSLTAHNDVRDLISELTIRLNALADSDDTTLDQLSEIVAYIKNNKSLIDGVTTSKVNKSGDTMTGKLNAHGGISLNGTTTSSNLQYILGCDAFAQGGMIRYQNASAVSVGKLGGLDADLFFCARTTGGNFTGDINTVYNNGAYWCQNATNKPTSDPYGLLIVQAAGTTDVIKQTYIPHIGNGLMGAARERIMVNNIWSPWRVIETEGNDLVCGDYFYMTDDEGQKRGVLRAIGDGSGTNNYGTQLMMGAGGNTFIGSGESASALYGALQTESNKKTNEVYSKVGENMFISSDGHLYLYSNANQIANRKGLCFSNAGILSPVGTDNISFGTLDLPFYDIFATNLRLKSKGANYGGKLLFGNGEYVYLQEFSDDKLRIHAGNGIFFDSNIYFGAEYTPSGSPDSTYKSYPLTIKSSGEVAFGASGYGQPILTTLNSSEIKAQNIKAYDLESVDTARIANILYFGSSGTTERIELGNRMLRFYGYNGLDFQSYIRSDICPTNTGMYTLGKSAYRWKEIWCSTSINTSSDRNLKKDIHDLSSDERYTQFFMLLQPKSYLFNDGESGRTHVGFISQDVEDAMVECGLTSLEFAGFCKDQKMKVKTEMEENHHPANEETGKGEWIEQKVKRIEEPVFDDEGNPVYEYSLRYEEFIALITMIVQRQQKKTENMEDQIDNMRDQILELKNKISL